MKKIIFQVAGTMDYTTVGIFDDFNAVLKYILENYGISFEDYKNEIMNEEGYEPTIDEWFVENEFNIIYTTEIN